MNDLADKTVLVTGGAQGIGKGIASYLLETGAQVVIADADEEAGVETVRELDAGSRLRYVAMRVEDEASVRSGIDDCIEAYGALHGLVNNAALADPDNGPLEQLSLQDWNRRLAVNLTGVFLCTKHALAALRRQRGAVVNIASTRALQSEPQTEAYSAAKGGVVALTHALAISLGPEVRVNCISPGWIDVKAWRKRAERDEPELSQHDHAQHPAGRVGRPEDVAGLCVYLLSDAAAFITAQNFVVDGGMSRKMVYEA